MKEIDNRLKCSDSKRAAIKATRYATAMKRQHQICKVYECKIVEKRLNKKQHEELDMLFIEGKWFYNHILNIHQSGSSLKDINTTKITEVKHFDKNKNEVESKLENLTSQQKQAIVTRMISNEKTIITLVKKGLQKHGNLQFKSELNCIPLKQYGNSYVFKSFNKVRISGISGKLLLRTGKQLQEADELANANLIKRPDGYFLKVTAYINKENFKQKETNNKDCSKAAEIGLDFGIKTNITTSEGDKLDACVEESERLKKLQKQMFRKVKGSNNRYKIIKQIQRQYQKLSNQKQDKANKIVSKLKAYKTIVIQDEQIANWHKGLFGKQVQHSCIGLVKAKLKQLPQTIILDKFIPTTKWCPKCGTVNKFMTLADRTYHCGCGYELDRDIHSAKNMLAIKNLVFEKYHFVPTEHREITLVEFKTHVDDNNIINKSER